MKNMKDQDKNTQAKNRKWMKSQNLNQIFYDRNASEDSKNREKEQKK